MFKPKINPLDYAHQLRLVQDPITSLNTFKAMYRGYIDDQMCASALFANLDNYHHIPKKLLTPELTKFYLVGQLKLNPKFFKDLTTLSRTSELCSVMFELDPASFDDIPLRYHTAKMCHTVVTKDPCKLGRISPTYRTLELCTLSVAKDGLQLKHVPVDVATTELCHTAVTNNPKAFKHVPLSVQTVELARLAVFSGYIPTDGSIRSDLLPAVKELRMEYQVSKIDYEPEAKPIHFKHVEPLDPRTLQEYMDMVLVNGYALGKVPREHRTMELCLTAVNRHLLALKYVPARHRTPELYLAAVTKWPTLISNLPTQSRTLRVMKAAVNVDPSVYVYTPKHLLGKIKKYLHETNPNFFMEESYE